MAISERNQGSRMGIGKKPQENGEFHRAVDSVLLTDPVVKEWSGAPIILSPYPGGRVVNEVQTYTYKPGVRMYIEGEEVIDSCQYPYWVKAVRAGIEKVQLKTGENLKVTEAGLGLFMCANRIIIEGLAEFHKTGRKIHYRGIELSEDVYERALAWKKNWLEAFSLQSNEGLDPEPNIEISLYQGEATEVAEDLSAKGKLANLIFADTYPIKKDTKGINDLLLLPGLAKHAVSDNAVFVFFSFTKETVGHSTGEVAEMQRMLLDEAFEAYNISTEMVPVSPPPDYKFLKKDDGTMVTSLPLTVVSQIKVRDEYKRK
ncbi:MAG TPA: hypothetical protein VFD45_01780 [Patescibacteria group bacterium]|nr:hypothetical protein [Patescibacteria group bacterium]